MNENQAFLDRAIHFVQETLTDESFPATLLVECPDPNGSGALGMGVIFLQDAFRNEQTRSQFEEAAPLLAKRLNATRVAMITEAWMLPIDKSDPASVARFEAYKRGEFRLADLPDSERQEILSIVVQSHDGEMLGTNFELVNDPTRSLGRNLSTGETYRVSSRFDFFPQQEEQQDLSEPGVSFDLDDLFA